MAKGDVTLRFDAQTAAAVQQILAARNALDAAAVKSREFGDATAKAGKKADDAFSKMSDTVKDAVFQIAGIGGAITTAAQIWDSSIEQMKKRAGDFLNDTRSLSDILGKRGAGGSYGQVNAFLNQAGQGKVSSKGMLSIYGAVSDQIAGRTDNEKIFQQATESGVRAVTSGMGEASAASFAKYAAEMLVQSGGDKGALSGLGAGNIDEVAFQLFKRAPGGISDKLWRFVDRSPDKMKGLDTILSVMDAHENPKALESIIDTADSPFDPVAYKKLKAEMKHPKERTIENQHKLKLMELKRDGKDVFAELLADPSLASPEAARLLGNLAGHEGTFVEDAVRNHPFAQQFRDYSRLKTTDPRLKADAANRAVEVQQEKIDHQNEIDDANHEAFEKYYDLQLQRGGIRNPTMRRIIVGGARILSAFSPNARDALIGVPEIQQQMTYERNQLENAQYVQDRAKMDAPRSPLSDPHLNELKKQTTLLEGQNKTLRTRRDTTLSNDSEGQK